MKAAIFQVYIYKVQEKSFYVISLHNTIQIIVNSHNYDVSDQLMNDRKNCRISHRDFCNILQFNSTKKFKYIF